MATTLTAKQPDKGGRPSGPPPAVQDVVPTFPATFLAESNVAYPIDAPKQNIHLAPGATDTLYFENQAQHDAFVSLVDQISGLMGTIGPAVRLTIQTEDS